MIESLRKDDDNRILSIRWSSGTETRHPYTFIRDNCQCSKCYSKSARARLNLLENLDIECMIKDVNINEDKTGINLTWNDGHEAPCGYEWLHKHGFTKEAKKENERLHHYREELWGHEYEAEIVKLNYDDIMSDDSALLKLLVTLDSKGLVIINKAPQKVGTLVEIGNRIAFLKPTLWGETFQVFSKAAPSDLAYTPCKLGLHTDGPFTYHSPGIQFLHCIKNTTVGGRNELSDGFLAAKILKEKYPELYEILLKRPIQYQNIGKDDNHDIYNLTRKLVFELDPNGKLENINFSHQTRDSYMDLEIEEVQKMYTAIKKFNDILYSRENLIHVQLQSGDIVAFNNTRVLHGREEYQHGPGLERHLEGGYVEWDQARSKIRILKKYVDFDKPN